MRETAESDTDEKRLADAVASAIESTRLITFRDVKVGVGQMNFLGRVDPKDEKAFILKGPMEALLRWSRKSKLATVFFADQYFIDDNDEMRHGWVVGLNYDPREIGDVVRDVTNLMQRYSKTVELTEVPLRGPATPQGSIVTSGGGRRGATPVK